MPAVTLPELFQFSQSKLQDYVDCPRRFQLRHLLMQPWPALITERPGEAEIYREQGESFHLLAHQKELGFDVEVLAHTIQDPELDEWWQTLLKHPPSNLPETIRRPERTLGAPLAGYRLVAKFDLLAVEPGERLVIVEWKTMHKRPSRQTLAGRLQTRVYRYLAVEAGAEVNGGQRPLPEQIEMLYWFARQSGDVQRFGYDTAQYTSDCDFLTGLLVEIASRREEIWTLTPDGRRCRFCSYRSLCERGVQPGFLEDLDEDLEAVTPEIDLEQIAEIEF